MIVIGECISCHEVTELVGNKSVCKKCDEFRKGNCMQCNEYTDLVDRHVCQGCYDYLERRERNRNQKEKFWKASAKIKNDVWKTTGGLCLYCGKETLPFGGNEEDAFVVDHLIPRIKGGTNDINNLVPACKSCNSKKGDLTIDEMRKRLVGSTVFFFEIMGWRIT